MTVQYLGNNNPDGTSFGQNSLSEISLYGKTPVAQQTAPTVVASIDPTVSSSALVASLQSIAVYAASQVNRIILHLSNLGVYA